MSKEQLTISPDDTMTPGERRHFFIHGIETDLENSIVEGSIENIVEGGFYGKSIILNSQSDVYPDFVVKTTEPGSPTKKIGRMANWDGKPFPPQYLEVAAQLDHLSSRITHLAIPEATNGRVISPNSYGYTDLGNLGYAQVLERMRGRGARFDTESNENGKLKAHRKLIWAKGAQMGLESTAQIHPDNPFGKPNVWLSEDGRVIWLDTLPAIPHKEWVFPYYWPPSNVFKFDFHRDVRDRFNSSDPTFNKIHTDQFRKFLDENQIVTSKEEEIRFLLDVYDDRLAVYDEETSQDTRNLIIKDSLKRGLIDRTQASELLNSDAKYTFFVANQYLTPIKQIATDTLTDSRLTRPFFNPETRREIKQFFRDPNFRRKKIMDTTFLRGLNQAYANGLITEREWSESWNLFNDNPENENLINAYISLQTAYVVSAITINILEGSSYISAFFSENPPARLTAGFFLARVAPFIVRPVLTEIIARKYDQNFRNAALYSMIPSAGNVLPIPVDIRKRYGEQSELIWHVTKRWTVASLSSLMKKWGGWNTDHEEQLWKTLKAGRW